MKPKWYQNLVGLVILLVLMQGELLGGPLTQEPLQPLPDVIFEKDISWLVWWHSNHRSKIPKDARIPLLIVIRDTDDRSLSEGVHNLTTYAVCELTQSNGESSAFVGVNSPPRESRIELQYSVVRVDASTDQVVANRPVPPSEARELFKAARGWVDQASPGTQEKARSFIRNREIFISISDFWDDGTMALPKEIVMAMNPDPGSDVANLVKVLEENLKNPQQEWKNAVE